MKITTRRLLVAGTATAIALGGLSAASAAPSTIDVRQSDFVTPGTAKVGNATVEFLKEGIHLKVPDAGTDYAIGVFPTNVNLADVGTVDYVWYGTASTPGVRYNVDVDADGKWDCQLMGEKAYGGTDVWLNRDSEDSPTKTLDPGACAEAAPVDGGGSGSQYHGDLDDWATKLAAVDNKTPKVVQAGYVAAGLVQDGVLRSIGLGETTYAFTSADAALPAEDVTATATITTLSGGRIKISVTGNAVTEGKSEGERAAITVEQGPRSGTPINRLKATVGAGETLVWTTVVPAGTPKQKIQVFSNGEKIGGIQAP